MRDAALPRFAVRRMYLDGRSAEVATIGLDDVTALPAGHYRLSPLQSAAGSAVDITLTDGQSAEVSYDATTGLMAE